MILKIDNASAGLEQWDSISTIGTNIALLWNEKVHEE